MSMKKISVICFALVMVFAMAACGGSKGEVYKVAMEPTFPPFDTTDKETGKLAGFDVDMMEAIAKDQGFTIEWSDMGFDGLIPALKADNIDIIASGMFASEEREAEVDFSETYYDSGLVLAVKESNTTVKSVADLTPEMKVGAQVGTSGAEEAQKLASEGKIKEAKIYNGLDVAVMDLQNGTIDGLVNDKPVTQTYMKEKPGEIKIVGDNINVEAYGIAVKEGNKELLKKINDGLKNIKENGEFDKIYKKWFE
ncbi:MAG: basic amino acid ABC transporter substrate-binding protein [Anaerovoracaceae bacterium]